MLMKQAPRRRSPACEGVQRPPPMAYFGSHLSAQWLRVWTETGTGKMGSNWTHRLGDRRDCCSDKMQAPLKRRGSGSSSRQWSRPVCPEPRAFAAAGSSHFLAAALGRRGIAGHVCGIPRAIQEIHASRDRNAEEFLHENPTTILARAVAAPLLLSSARRRSRPRPKTPSRSASCIRCPGPWRSARPSSKT